MGNDSRQIAPEASAAIAGRLAPLPSLRLPAHLRRGGGGVGGGAPTADQQLSEVPLTKRVDYLRALLERDPGVFLERHGELLTAAERAEFDCLR